MYQSASQLIASTKTVINSHTKITPYRHFGIHPGEDPVEDKGSVLTFRFVSASRNPLSLNLHHHQLTTALKFSHPHADILQSKERTAVYPVLQLCYGNYDVNTRIENYTIQGYVTQSCVYKEIRQFEPDETCNGRDYRFNSYFIILGFKTADTQALLDSWKDWTGARYIYLNFPDQLSLRKITLYHKETLDEVNLFNYIVKVECGDVDTKEKQTILLDFVQRLRAERTSNFCSLYEDVIT